MLTKKSMIFNGSYIETIIPGYTTVGVTGRETLSTEISSQTAGAKDGSIFSYKRYEPRTLTISFTITASDNTELLEKLETLNGILDEEEVKIIFRDEPDRYYIGTKTDTPDIQTGYYGASDTFVAAGSFDIYCSDPFKYSVTEKQADGVIEDDGSTTFVVDYDGTYKAHPKLQVDFYSPGTNPTSDITVPDANDLIEANAQVAYIFAGAMECGSPSIPYDASKTYYEYDEDELGYFETEIEKEDYDEDPEAYFTRVNIDAETFNANKDLYFTVHTAEASSFSEDGLYFENVDDNKYVEVPVTEETFDPDTVFLLTATQDDTYSPEHDYFVCDSTYLTSEESYAVSNAATSVDADETTGEENADTKGDCGYVAFFNQDGRILQFGDPDMEDPAASEGATVSPIQSSFKSSGGYSQETKDLWQSNFSTFDDSTFNHVGYFGESNYVKVDTGALSNINSSKSSTWVTLLTVNGGTKRTQKIKYSYKSGSSTKSATASKVAYDPKIVVKCYGVKDRTSSSVKVYLKFYVTLPKKSCTIPFVTKKHGTTLKFFNNLTLSATIAWSSDGSTTSSKTVTLKKKTTKWKKKGKQFLAASTNFVVSDLDAATNIIPQLYLSVSTNFSPAFGKVSSTKLSKLNCPSYMELPSDGYYLTPYSYGNYIQNGKENHGPAIFRYAPKVDGQYPKYFQFQTGLRVCQTDPEASTSKKAGKTTTYKTTNEECGGLRAFLLTEDNEVIAGFDIKKTSQTSSKGKCYTYINSSSSTDTSSNIDLSYNNKYFANTDATCTIERAYDSNEIVIKIGSAEGYNYTVKGTLPDEDVDKRVCRIMLCCYQYKNYPVFSWNGFRFANFTAYDKTSAETPAFSSKDRLIVDCSNGEVLLNGVRSPGLGALGNDWDRFALIPGQSNQIGTAYSSWVDGTAWRKCVSSDAFDSQNTYAVESGGTYTEVDLAELEFNKYKASRDYYIYDEDTEKYVRASSYTKGVSYYIYDEDIEDYAPAELGSRIFDKTVYYDAIFKEHSGFSSANSYYILNDDGEYNTVPSPDEDDWASGLYYYKVAYNSVDNYIPAYYVPTGEYWVTDGTVFSMAEITENDFLENPSLYSTLVAREPVTEWGSESSRVLYFISDLNELTKTTVTASEFDGTDYYILENVAPAFSLTYREVFI